MDDLLWFCAGEPHHTHTGGYTGQPNQPRMEVTESTVFVCLHRPGGEGVEEEEAAAADKTEPMPPHRG